MLKDTLNTVLSQTYRGVSNINAIKLNCDNKKTKIVTVTEDHSLIVNGQIGVGLVDKPVTIGCMRLNILQSCLNFELFDESTRFKYKEDIPYSIEFLSEYGHSAEYRLTLANKINELIEFDFLDEIAWDISSPIDSELYLPFRQVSSAFAKNENRFYVKNKDDGFLYFVVGGYGMDSMEFPVLKANGKWASSFKWSIDNFNSVMNICSTAESINVNINEATGLMNISPQYKNGDTWEYYLMAKVSNE